MYYALAYVTRRGTETPSSTRHSMTLSSHSRRARRGILGRERKREKEGEKGRRSCSSRERQDNIYTRIAPRSTKAAGHFGVLFRGVDEHRNSRSLYVFMSRRKKEREREIEEDISLAPARRIDDTIYKYIYIYKCEGARRPREALRDDDGDDDAHQESRVGYTYGQRGTRGGAIPTARGTGIALIVRDDAPGEAVFTSPLKGYART